MRNKKGFSLIELIVIIAMMSILTGVLTPLFVKYINDRKERACRQNREAILNEYAKHVYSGDFEVEQSELALFLTASDADKTSSDTLEQIKRYIDCPSADGATHYTGYIDGTNAYIICDDHKDEVCVLDFTGWAGIASDEGKDVAYDIPEVTVSTPSGQPPIPGDPEDPDTPTSLNSVWPHKQDVNGVEDVRWSKARDDQGNYVNGLSNSAGVWLKLPKYAHFQDTLSGGEYVIVQGNRSSNWTGGDAIFIKYEYAYGPDAVANSDGFGDLTKLIKVSSRHYDNKSATPPGGNSNSFTLKKGDLYTYYFTDASGVERSNTFIASADSTTVNINNEGAWFKQTGEGNSEGLTAEEWKYKHLNDGTFCYVPPLAKSIDISDF